MTADYYATLGVAPSSEDVVIRAAYVALMRRYHPDSNDSPAAAERAKAITVAYAVLSDPDRRIDYDRARRSGDPYRPDEREIGTAPNRFGKAQFEKVAIFAAVMMLLLLPLYLIRYPLTITAPPGLARADSDRPVLARRADPAQSCVSRAAHDLLQQQLVRRAGLLRRGDRAEFERVAGNSFLRIDTALTAKARKDGAIDCTAVAVLLVPPGTAAVGRRALTAELDYSLVGGEDGRAPTLFLANADPIARRLALLTRLPRPADEIEPLPLPAPEVPLLPPARLPPAQLPPVAVPSVPIIRTPPPANARPVRAAPVTAAPVTVARPQAIVSAKPAEPSINASFNCKFAKGRGEVTVCKSPNLAKLDRQLAVLYGQSWGLADADKRAALLRTREQFIARRDNCQSDSCVTTAYLGRMREVTGIMSGASESR